MPGILSTKPLAEAQALQLQFYPPCGAAESAIADHIAKQLDLRRDPLNSSPFRAACRPRKLITGLDVLLGPSVDEPDAGMDESLDDRSDPAGDRMVLGGKVGPVSKAFRHVYYQWKITDPFASFHVPLRTIGQGPDRAALMAMAAREALRANQPAWGFRLLSWSLHYFQDLAQPFHSSQLLTPLILPWKFLFSGFLSESLRVTTNYHWALEGYVTERARQGSESPWAECLANPSQYWTLEADPFSAVERQKSPREIAVQVARASLDMAGELGRRARSFFGSELAGPVVSMPDGTIKVDYAALSIRPDISDERKALHETVCKCLANSAWATQWLIGWAL